MMTTECAGCYRPILDRFLLYFLDKTWHSNCVQCQLCRKLLDEKCFYKEGKIYCHDDFYRCFGTKCGGCGDGIHPTDFVRKARDKVYHLRCFTCSQCSKQLSTGEILYLSPKDESFVCKDDYLSSQQDNILFSDEEDEYDDGVLIPGLDHRTSPPTSHPGSDTLSNPSLTPTPNHKLENNNNNNNSLLHSKDSRHSLGDCSLLKDDMESLDEDGDSKSPEGDDGPGGKRRGPRTTIKAKQLEVLKNAFSQTPKPTRHIREQLAKETGLTMRVIQVWFQNKRSKERRMKQMTTGMMPSRGFFPGKSGRRGFPMIGDDFGYFPSDKPFVDFGAYSNFHPPIGDFFPGSMGFIPPGSHGHEGSQGLALQSSHGSGVCNTPTSSPSSDYTGSSSVRVGSSTEFSSTTELLASGPSPDFNSSTNGGSSAFSSEQGLNEQMVW